VEAEMPALGGARTPHAAPGARLRWEKLALSLGATVVIVAALAGGGEVAVRYRERHRSTMSGTMPLLYYRHARLGHALVRDFDYFGWVHVDREGFRGPEVAVEKAPGTVRIMAVGSSTTFDPAVSGDQATWPARLEVWLNRLAPQHPVEVVNAGVPGYRVIDDVIRLEVELYRFRPDVVILYEGHNDLFGALRRGREPPPAFSSTPDETPAVSPWTHWLSRHSLLYGELVGRFKVLRFSAAGQRASGQTRASTPPADDVVVDSGAARFERDLTVFLSVARSLGVRVVVPELVDVSGVGTVEEPDSATHREWSYTMPFARVETVLRAYVRFNSVLRDVAACFGATWVPTTSFGLDGRAWYDAGDPIHFNDRGADRMAQRLAQGLLNAGVLEAATRRPSAPRRCESASGR
jgi:lysophospholipase L1-like esterase